MDGDILSKSDEKCAESLDLLKITKMKLTLDGTTTIDGKIKKLNEVKYLKSYVKKL